MDEKDAFENFINGMSLHEEGDSQSKREQNKDLFKWVRKMIFGRFFQYPEQEERPPLSGLDKVVSRHITKVLGDEMGKRLEHFTEGYDIVYPMEEAKMRQLIQMGADAALFLKKNGKNNDAD